MDDSTAAPPGAAVQFCRSRSAGRRCTRTLGHPGLHRHRTIMWTSAASDGARCPGSGDPGRPAEPLADGYPDGRALCERCLRFIDLGAEDRLVEHDTADETETDAGAARRREWFNLHGW